MTARRNTTEETRLREGEGHDPRSMEQEVAGGKTPETPVAVFAGVIGVVALLVAFALVLAALAYFLA